jgi:hypothetical protein
MHRRAFILSLALLPLTPQSTRAAEPVPTPRKIFFPTGSTRGTVGGHVQRGRRDLYSLQASAGQIMTVTITAPDDNVTFQIWEPDTTMALDSDGILEFKGAALRGAGETDDATRWSGRLPRTGTYLIAVGGTRGNARYSVDVKIE